MHKRNKNELCIMHYALYIMQNAFCKMHHVMCVYMLKLVLVYGNCKPYLSS